MSRFLVLLLFSLFAATASGQDTTLTDSALQLPVADTLYDPFKDSAWLADTLPSRRMDTIFLASATGTPFSLQPLEAHPYFRFTNPTRYSVSIRQWEGKEDLFYALIGLLIIFALIRNGFVRYIQDLFKIFFRTTVRQRQIKEQLLQSPLPSLLLNIFFILSLGMFAALALQHFRLGEEWGFWMLYVYAVLALAGIYLLKFIILKFIGWTLQASEAAETYIFVVFTTNKIMGMLILPFIILLAFSYGSLAQVALTGGLVLVGGFFAYRYFLSYVSVYRQLRMSAFHFLLYLLAFEIVPLLLINKLLFTILKETS